MLAVVNCFFGACSAACSIVPGSSGLFCCLFNCGWVIRIIGCQASCQPFSQMRSIENTLPDSICSTNIQQDSYSRLLYGYGEIITNHPLIIGYYRLNTVNTHINIYICHGYPTGHPTNVGCSIRRICHVQNLMLLVGGFL